MSDGHERGTERGDPTWVSGEADNLGASEAVMVVALGTNKKGGSIGRNVPPALEAGEVYVLIGRNWSVVT
jgi:hypothetical protein